MSLASGAGCSNCAEEKERAGKTIESDVLSSHRRGDANGDVVSLYQSPNQLSIYSSDGRIASAELAAEKITPGVSGATPSSSIHPGPTDSRAQQSLAPDKAIPEESEKADKEQQVEQQKREEIRDLASRDREVRAHELAHAAVGGSFAGAPKYDFVRGPDGVAYAVSGEVSIDVGPASTPQKTIEKAQSVRRAALAPTNPSPQDRLVAQQAAQLEAQARQDLATERSLSLQDEQTTKRNAENDEAGLTERPDNPVTASSISNNDVSSIDGSSFGLIADPGSEVSRGEILSPRLTPSEHEQKPEEYNAGRKSLSGVYAYSQVNQSTAIGGLLQVVA
jgi:hypothetical protein